MDKDLKAFAAKLREVREDLNELYEAQPESWYASGEAEDVRYALDSLADAAERLDK